MNTQYDISSGPSVPRPAFSLRSIAGFERTNPQFAIGFTLVELLVVVGIIALLAGILLPSLNRFAILRDKAKTQSAINLIDGACRHYFNDFEDYPPSHDDAYGGWTGSELLVLFLTGYGPDTGSDGVPGADIFSDDGVDGYGFRVVQRGDVHGPYGGAEKLAVRSDPRPEFVDTFGVFGNPILYYRWDSDDSEYKSGHNTDGPGDLTLYTQTADAAYYRSDFILISRGNNEVWDAPHDMNSDDVTNFFN